MRGAHESSGRRKLGLVLITTVSPLVIGVIGRYVEARFSEQHGKELMRLEFVQECIKRSDTLDEARLCAVIAEDAAKE